MKKQLHLTLQKGCYKKIKRNKYFFQHLLLLSFLLIFTNGVFAQITYEKGYVISNTDKKISCFIKNIDWDNNPEKIEYKISLDAAPLSGSVENIKEFYIEGYSKYLRRTVKIDEAKTGISSLDKKRNPNFSTKTIFLKTLIEGKANLYSFKEKNSTFYFYALEAKKIEQLIYKKYLNKDNYIAENNYFRQQLLNNLKCKNLSKKDFEKLTYKEDKISDIINRYNSCFDLKTQENSTVLKKPREFIHLNIRPGLRFNSLDVFSGIASSSRNFSLNHEATFRIGAELEATLPFHKNKWSILFEPTYSKLSANTNIANKNVAIDYSSFEFPFGIRHYFFLNKTSKFFINGLFVFESTGDSSILYETGSKLTIKSISNLAFGFGFKVSKFSVEARYLSNRDILSEYQMINSKFNSLSLIVGYTIF